MKAVFSVFRDPLGRSGPLGDCGSDSLLTCNQALFSGLKSAEGRNPKERKTPDRRLVLSIGSCFSETGTVSRFLAGLYNGGSVTRLYLLRVSSHRFNWFISYGQRDIVSFAGCPICSCAKNILKGNKMASGAIWCLID